jgi:hypothetical protein
MASFLRTHDQKLVSDRAGGHPYGIAVESYGSVTYGARNARTLSTSSRW